MKLTNRLDPHVEYVFRHIPTAVPSEVRNFLSGYGVALDLKKMDYLALDDRNANAEGKSFTGTSHNSEMNSIIGGSRSTFKSDTEQEEQPVDPILSLIFSHPENTSAPDSSVALTTEEFASKSTSHNPKIGSLNFDLLQTLEHKLPK